MIARIAVIGLLGMMSGSLLQYSLTVAAPVLVSDLGMTEPQVGLVASALMLSATVLVGFVGRVADQLGPRRALIVLHGSAAASLGMLAVARSLGGVIAAAIVGGLAVACGNPVTNRVVASVPSASGFIVGVKQSGVVLAQVMCGLALPVLTLLASWRWGVAALMLVPLLGVVMGGGSPRHVRDASDSAHSGGGNETARGVGWLAVYSFLAAWATSMLATYLPVFAVSRVGLSLIEAGAIVIAMGVAGFLGRLAWATLIARLSRPEHLLALLSVCGSAALGMVGVAESAGPVLLWGGAIVVGGGLAGFTGAAQVIVLRSYASAVIGRVTGVVQIGFLGGLFVGPAGAGLLLAAGGYSLLWGTAVAVALGSAFVTVAAPATPPAGRRS